MVTKLREFGKKLPKDKLKKPLEGDLELIHYKTTGRDYCCATLSALNPIGMLEILSQLYEPKLMGLKDNTMLLEGYEKDKDGTAYLQAWRCLLVDIGGTKML